MAERDPGDEHARPAGGYEPPRAQCDQLLEKGRGQRRADTRMDDPEPIAPELDHEDRVLADLRHEAADPAAVVVFDDTGDDVLEEAQDDTVRDISRCVQLRGLENGRRLGIELEDRRRLALRPSWFMLCGHAALRDWRPGTSSQRKSTGR
jgi:hypothetical protein